MNASIGLAFGLSALLVVCTSGCRTALRGGGPRDAGVQSHADVPRIEGTGGTGAGGLASGGRSAGGGAELDSGFGGMLGSGGLVGLGGTLGSGGLTGSGGRAGGGGIDSGGAESRDDGCSTIAAELASEMAETGTCTAVVRLDYSTLTIISYAFVCGQYDPPDEANARSRASTDAHFSPGSVGKGRLLSGSNPTDEWVFFQSPLDFGGAAAVSARSGLTVFAGSIVWMGKGAITVPSAWNARALGVGCAAPKGLSVRGFDLSQGEAPPRFDEAAAAVLQTGLPTAFQRWGDVFDVVVLLYPRTLGTFVSSTAEYIVLVNGGTSM